MYPRVQGFDASAHDFGRTRVIGNFGYRQAGRSQGFRCSAGAEQSVTQFAEPGSEFNDASFV